MPKWASRVGLLNIALMILLAVPLLAHIYNGHFSRFMADDYCTSAVGLEYGAIGGALHWYNTWSGRYTNFVIKSLIAPLGSGFAAVLPALIIVSLLASVFWVASQICTLLRLRQPRIAALIAALVIVYATVDGAPALIQSVYWLNGVIPNTGPLILVTLYVGIFIHALTHESSEGRLPLRTIIVGFCVTLLIGGFSEIYMAFQIAALVIASGLALLFLPSHLKRPALSILIVSLIGALMTLILVVTSPGSLVRQSRFPDRLPLPEMMVQALGYSSAFFASALAFFAPFALLTALSTSTLLAFRQPPVELPFRLYPARVRWLMALSAATAFILVTSAITPGVYAVSGPPPGRTFILSTFIIVLMAAFWGFLIGFTLRKKTSQQNFLVIAVFMLIFSMGPGASVWRSVTLAPKLRVYAAEWDEQERQIRLQAADGSDNIVVKPLSVDLPQLIGLDTIGPDATSGANPCAADYYGVENIVAE
jgi:Family of unknown function (DUF6056)